MQFLVKHWFLVGVVVSILLARAAPEVGAKDGPLLPEYTVKYGAVSLIFMISGLSLRTQQLSAAVRNVPLHAFVQGFTLLFIPLLFYLFVVPGLTAVGLDVWLARGLMVVGCMPPPVSSAVILTKASARRPTPDSYTPENARERFARVGARLTRAPPPFPNARDARRSGATRPRQYSTRRLARSWASSSRRCCCYSPSTSARAAPAST